MYLVNDVAKAFESDQSFSLYSFALSPARSAIIILRFLKALLCQLPELFSFSAFVSGEKILAV